jgi:hypothetical protein
VKCPFRTVTVEEQFNTKDGKVTSVEFADCLKNDCPYYGKKEIKIRQSGGFETVIDPVCRRAECD